MVKQTEWDRLVQQAADIKDRATLLFVDNVITKEMVKLKSEITAKNTLNMSMQAKLRPATQDVKATKNALATAEDGRDVTSEKMESAMVELNATNEATIQVKANCALISSFQVNHNNCIFNVKMTEMPT